MPAPSPAPSLNVTTGGGEGEGKAVETEGKKGEVVPPEGERETADTKGINEADEGGEYK
ncbi:hypothetical protein BDY24DRAFT_383511 [Mrakia frigida]|uniref:uncharacterized protein n=1 Tax=Mrakia frigida TaxID=29902 RepID=UPI003FCC0756